jgi:hypothetical protein
MKKILVSHKNVVEFSNEKVQINGREVTDLDGKTNEQYAYDQARFIYSSILSNHFENLVVLTGAGSSVGIGIDNKVGKTMKELWFCVLEHFKESNFRSLCDKIKFNYPDGDEYGDLEALLSRANVAKEFVDVEQHEIENQNNVEDSIIRIQEIIKRYCSLPLPSNSHHELFLKKITSRKLKYPRTKIFTLNYDTLFEQAASRCGYSVIDGFSFSFPRTFNGKNFDYDIVVRENSRIKNEENYASRVFHLYKPHGSIDWDRDEKKIFKAESPIDPVMIYPKSTKYESSYEQPFFEMMARFQQALRRENVFLISIGFSFYDKHIASIILEALEINPSFSLMVVTLGIESNDNLNRLTHMASQHNNIIVIEERFVDFVEQYPFNEIHREQFGEAYENKPI